MLDCFFFCLQFTGFRLQFRTSIQCILNYTHVLARGGPICIHCRSAVTFLKKNIITLTSEFDISLDRFINYLIQSVTVSRCVTLVMAGCFCLSAEACWRDLMEGASFCVKCVHTSSAKSDRPHSCNSCRCR